MLDEQKAELAKLVPYATDLATAPPCQIAAQPQRAYTTAVQWYYHLLCCDYDRLVKWQREFCAHNRRAVEADRPPRSAGASSEVVQATASAISTTWLMMESVDTTVDFLIGHFHFFSDDSTAVVHSQTDSGIGYVQQPYIAERFLHANIATDSTTASGSRSLASSYLQYYASKMPRQPLRDSQQQILSIAVNSPVLLLPGIPIDPTRAVRMAALACGETGAAGSSAPMDPFLAHLHALPVQRMMDRAAELLQNAGFEAALCKDSTLHWLEPTRRSVRVENTQDPGTGVTDGTMFVMRSVLPCNSRAACMVVTPSDVFISFPDTDDQLPAPQAVLRLLPAPLVVPVGVMQQLPKTIDACSNNDGANSGNT